RALPLFPRGALPPGAPGRGTIPARREEGRRAEREAMPAIQAKHVPDGYVVQARIPAKQPISTAPAARIS
ncbi:unnamed protein product, partial [marine sediment metagenome]